MKRSKRGPVRFRPPGVKVPKQMTPEEYAASGTEHGLQVAVFMWIQQTGQHQWPRLNMLFAVPNGGLRNPATAAALVAEGVKRGVPDLVLPVPVAPYHGLFIENKKPAGGVASEFQIKWRRDLIEQGYAVKLCYTFERVRDCLIAYMQGQNFN